MNTLMLALVLAALPTAPPLPTPKTPPSGLSMQPADRTRVSDLSGLRGTYDPSRVARVSFGITCWNRDGAYRGMWDDGAWSPGDAADWEPTLLDHGTWVPLATLPSRAQLPPGGQCSVEAMATNRDGALVTRIRYTLLIAEKM